MRIVGALLAGLAAAIVVIAAMEFVAAAIYSPPATSEAMANLPTGAFALVLLGYGLGTFAGAFLAARIGRSAVYGFVIGAALLAAGLANMMLVPHPTWFWAAGILMFVVTTFIAVRTAIPARAPATTTTG
jgi:hypothetical protein